MAVLRGVLVVLVLGSVAACGDDADGGSGTDEGAAPASVEEVCDTVASGDDAAVDALLERPPAELEDQARIIREAEASGDDESEAAAAAANDFLDWVELNCELGGAGAIERRVAPPVEASFDGLEPCGTLPSFPSPPVDGAGMVLYGDVTAQDPYGGPMVGLLWNPPGEGGHAGDGEQEPVTVRGQDGVAAPITVFQQTILPELGTVVAWTEDGREVGLYGRGWPVERADELVEIAEGITEADGGLTISAEALPDGFGQVYAGDPGAAAIVLAPGSLYSVQYQSAVGMVTVEGLELDEDAFESFRFFATDVAPADVAGRAGLRGNAWGDRGPAVATWREPDGLVVRIVGMGVPPEAVDEVAGAARELTDDEWTAVVEADGSCFGP